MRRRGEVVSYAVEYPKGLSAREEERSIPGESVKMRSDPPKSSEHKRRR